jgi:predicted ABC-type transport system involved in lysophospholipase L1 biosynthesis ATPase subunit
MEPNRVPSAIRKERAIELLAMVRLERRAHHFPGQLSGGEQQRVAIARALANRPVLLLADEPTGNLDKKNRGAIVDLLIRVARESGTTMVVVTHDARVSERCDLEYSLRDGVIRPTHRTSKRLAQLQSDIDRGQVSIPGQPPLGPTAAS